ncbi:TolC family outer membrane protein [Chitinilyticum piscinae]|uniref:TolC family outer membrane protein n=1 Tax=Chitinilyticum piscinae TaxID=2866724 RepID=A0A8J7FM28_9NEIS|nr:TolC family outer membrane protein [Chitinilyticum piscinae]MBE9610592.1 TolC family outer membrane protein [Chitinilyticum piscinae]
MKLKPLFLAFATLLALPASALDLVGAWQAAKQHDPSYSAARQALLAGKEKAVQGRALLLPQVELAAGASHVRQENDPGVPTLTNPRANTSGDTYRYALSLTQPLFRMDAFVAADQLGKQSDLSEVQFRLTEQQLMLKLSLAYFEVLAAQEKVTLAVAQLEAFSQQLAQAQKSFEVGVATITDVNEAKARYDATTAAEIVARNELAVKQNALRLITGEANARLATIADREPLPPQPNVLDEWLSRSGKGSLELQAQQLNLAIAGREIDRYRTEYSPTLDLVASYGNNYQREDLSRNGGTDRSGQALVGVQLSIPLFTGGRMSSQYRESVANRDQQADRLEATRRDVEQATTQSFLGVTAGAAQIRALQQSLVSSQSLLESTKLGYEVGVSTMVDVLNANQRYYETRYQLVVAKYTYLYAGLQLAAATGALDESVLQKVNGWLIESANTQ